MTMTDDQTRRLAEYRALFDALPGPRNADRIRQAAARAHVKEQTVRVWAMRNPPSVPSERVLALLRA
jgi:hypothetical protein